MIVTPIQHCTTNDFCNKFDFDRLRLVLNVICIKIRKTVSILSHRVDPYFKPFLPHITISISNLQKSISCNIFFLFNKKVLIKYTQHGCLTSNSLESLKQNDFTQDVLNYCILPYFTRIHVRFVHKSRGATTHFKQKKKSSL